MNYVSSILTSKVYDVASVTPVDEAHALSAKRLGVKATIVMPETTPEIKINAVKAHGASIVLHGDGYGRVLVGFQVPKREEKTFRRALDEIGYAYREVTDNPACRDFVG